VYATALNTFEHLAGRLIADAGLGEPPTPARADRISTDALAPIKRDLDTIGLIGSQDTVVLTNQVVADFEILAARMCHQARWGDEPMGDLNDELTRLRNRIWELHAQFRTDLASTRERHRTKVASAGEARHQDRCRRLPFDESAERTLCQSSEYPDGLQHGLCEMCGRHQTRGSAGGGVCLAVGDTVVVAVGEQWIRAAGPHRLDLGCDGNPSQQCNARDVGP
jgi:hypothetical protein